MRVAVIADVHANMFALEAVARRIEDIAPDELWCAGDLVGYNAQPSDVLAWVRENATVVVAGNHDVDIVTRAAQTGTNNAARQAQAWTRDQLDDAERDYLASLPYHHVSADGLELAHGCYLNSHYFTGYVTWTMLRANLDALASRGQCKVGVCGHTHQPMIGYLKSEGVTTMPTGEVCTWPENADAVLINPGSVGQPRDRDPRAAFALIDTTERTVELHRCDYDVAAAQSAIERAGLPAELSHRLGEGR